jgi:hypothetical protein
MTTPTHRRSLALWCAVASAALGAAVFGGRAAADTDDEPPAAKSCLYESELRRTTVLDDRTILFTTRDGQTYSNSLPQQCPMMRSNSILNYTVEQRRICAGSMFQLLVNYGFGLTPGVVCALGLFVPISEHEAGDLIARSKQSDDNPRRRRRSERDMVHIEPVEPPSAPANEKD